MPLPLIAVLIMTLSIISIIGIISFFVGDKITWLTIFILPLLLIVIWFGFAEINRPYIIVQTDIHTINGVQICVIDGNPINITQLTNRIFDEKQFIRVKKYNKWSYGINYMSYKYVVEQ